jgi:preprotein translocase subunit SecA
LAAERIASLMDKMGYKEGEVIQHSMISIVFKEHNAKSKKIILVYVKDYLSMMM